MISDIVFPRNNEKEFAEMAERLGYEQLVFVYEKAVPKLELNTSIKIIQKKAKSFAMEGDRARHYFESGNVRIVYALENKSPRDFMHQRASGLNHILCRIAKQKNKIIGFSFGMILNSTGMERVKILGRVMQNTRLCRKYKVKTFIGSFAKHPFGMRASKDLQAFFQAVGMTGEEVKEALEIQIPG